MPAGGVRGDALTRCGGTLHDAGHGAGNGGDPHPHPRGGCHREAGAPCELGSLRHPGPSENRNPAATKVLAGGRKPIAKRPTVAWPHARRGHPDAQRHRHSLWTRVGRLIAPPGAPARAPGNLQRCLAGLPGPLRRRLRALAPVWPHHRQPAAHPRRRRRAPLRGRDAGARCATLAAPRRARPIPRSGSPSPAQPRYLRNGGRNPAEDRAARQAERARRRVRHRTA